MQNRHRPAAHTSLVEIVGVVLIAGVVALLAYLLPPDLTRNQQLLAGIALALVPAALWLIAFYRQDLEPEPKFYVLGVFVLSGLLAQTVGEPLIRSVFRYPQWADNDLLVGYLGALLLVGGVQEFLKYAAVRYTVYQALEFDQPVDGLIYAASAGLGYATILNLNTVLNSTGMAPGVLAIQTAVTALAHASSAAITGYFLGTARFQALGRWWVPGGLFVAALFNGMLATILALLPSFGSFGRNDWVLLGLAAAIAGAIFLVLLRVIRTLNTNFVYERLARRTTPPSLRLLWPVSSPEWPVLLVLAGMLSVGGGLGWWSLQQTKSATLDRSQLLYPARWTASYKSEGSFEATDLRAGLYGPRLSLRMLPATSLSGDNAQLAPDDLIISWPLVRSRELAGFHILRAVPQPVAGRQGLRIEYAYLAEPPRGAAPGVMPGLMRAIDTLAASDDQIYVLTVAVEHQNETELDHLYQETLAGWQLP